MSAFGWHIQTTEEAKAMKFATETMAAAVISERDRRFEDNRISNEEHREEVAQMQAEREELAQQLLYSEIGRQKANDEIERLRMDLVTERALSFRDQTADLETEIARLTGERDRALDRCAAMAAEMAVLQEQESVPDGGDVSIAEQVQRMRAEIGRRKENEEIAQLRTELDELRRHATAGFYRQRRDQIEIERLRAENERLREALAKSGLALNRIRTDIECTIANNSGMAKGSAPKPEDRMNHLRTKIRDALTDYCYSTRTDIVESAVDAVFAVLQEQESMPERRIDDSDYSVGWNDCISMLQQIAAAESRRCKYPNCLDNEDERCARWLLGECAGPPTPPKPATTSDATRTQS